MWLEKLGNYFIDVSKYVFPPHFHVRYMEHRALVDIANGTITGTMPRRALKMIYEWLDLHQEELMDNWNRLQRGEEFKKINPLD